MGKFSRIHHYISKEDLKRVHEQKVRAKKLESERIEEEKEEIKAEFEQLKSDWRNELRESDFTNITKGNKVGQTFQHVSGATITLDGALGGKMMVPSQVTLDLGFGEKITVDGPAESDFALTGFTKPLDLKVMQRQNVKTAKEINDQLDASIKVSDVDTAKVDIGEDDLGYKSTDEILADVGDQWTYDEYMAMLDAIADKAAAAEEPIAKAIAEYSPTGSTPGDVPISLIDAQEAITNARHKAEQALHQAWERYNKVPDLPDGGDKSSLLDNIASKMKVGTAKNVFDLHLNYLKNPTGKVQNINNLISKKDINALSKTITDNATIDQLKFDVRGLYGVLQNTIDQNSGLRNSLGNLDQSKIYLNDSQTEVVIEKPYDFSGLKDLQGAGDIKTKVGAPVYAGLNVLQGKMSVKDFFTGTDTMMIRVNIPIKKKKVNESTAFSKIKKFRNKY